MATISAEAAYYMNMTAERIQDLSYPELGIARDVVQHHMAYINDAYAKIPWILRYTTKRGRTVRLLRERYTRLYNLVLEEFTWRESYRAATRSESVL